MPKPVATLSPAFKKQANKAIAAIVIFIITYLILLALATGLTALCVYSGFALIINNPGLLTIILGMGLASLGVLVLIFLVKFIFTSHKTDRSHLYEIKQEDEPALFRLINDIVEEVGTHFPKKVYLSSDVNAAVFYDSSFWSMILPVKKNLQIGIGMVNSVTSAELKAILAHEFGHFSQRTMKVGSYVYNVNHVIFNMLYDNDSYGKIVQKWASITGYFSIFTIIAVRIIAFVQWILKKLYAIVNKRYMGLSREMEFHADEIAAGVTGYQPLKSSLLRLSLADHAFNAVLRFYDEQVVNNIQSANIYKEQTYVMHFFAKDSKVAIVNDLPVVTIEDLNRYNKSKLVIKDQWASHPSTEDRVKRLELLGNNDIPVDNTPANRFFTNIETLQQTLSQKIFSQVTYQGEIKTNTLENFIEQFDQNFKNNSFSAIYNGYYDNKSPVYFDSTTVNIAEAPMPFEYLFSPDKINMVYDAISLQNDFDTLTQIAGKNVDITTFDYNGRKYKKKHATILQQELKVEIDAVNEQLKTNDLHIFNYFHHLEKSTNNNNRLITLYTQFFEYDKSFEASYQHCSTLHQNLQFISHSLPVEQITANFSQLETDERKFKELVSSLLAAEVIQTEINEEVRKNFESYLSKQLVYFAGDVYYEENLKVLFTAINDYAHLSAKTHFLLKKQLLDYQEQLQVRTNAYIPA